jgi:AcrR family transcriptional regulator
VTVPTRSAATRPALSRDRVIQVALDVADAEGVEAVTMRRLAEGLHVHPTSLYNHVATKEAILDGMADALIGEAGFPETFDDWSDWVRAMAVGLRDAARAHPGAFLVLAQRAASGPFASAVSEAALDAFRRAGFTPREAAEALAAVSLALLGVALNECPPTAPFSESDPRDVSADQYPRIAEVVAVAPELGNSDGVWDLVVDSLIAGLTARVVAPGRGSRGSAHRSGRPVRR